MHKLAALASLLPLVAGHGYITSPPARHPGEKYKEVCGTQPYYQQMSDINGNIQGIQQVVGSDETADCNLWLCKGFQLSDTPDNVQSYSLGQTVDFKINIAAPHTGYANVSVVKTSTNAMIGDPLIYFSNYAANAGVAPNNSAFSVTLPKDLGGDCTAAGDCVLQWFWNAPSIDQTYEGCVDFTVGAGAGASAGSTSAAATSVAASSAVSPSATAPSAVTTASTPSLTYSAPSLTGVPTTLATVTRTSSAAPVATSTSPDDEPCPDDDGNGSGDDSGDDCGDDDGSGNDGAGSGGDDEPCPDGDGDGDGSGDDTGGDGGDDCNE